MRTRTRGSRGPSVSALGLRCLGMSDLYGPAAADLELGREDLASIEAAIPRHAVAGDRYPPHAMAVLDSERRGEGQVD